MKVKIIILLIVCSFISCTKKQSDFEVINKTKQKIDSVKISCSGSNYENKVVAYNIGIDNMSKLSLDMNDISKTDGNYLVEVFSLGVKKSKNFGYYTNGSPSGSTYIVQIKNDSININERID